MSDKADKAAPEHTADPKQDVLHRRAEDLAKAVEDNEQDLDLILVVEFLLAGELYALDADQIVEVAPIQELVPLPGTPDFILGIVNLRGEIRSVVDLRKVFGIAGPHPHERGHVIVLGNGDMEFGLFAEEVLGAHSLHHGDMSDSLPTLTDIRAEFLKGVTAQGLVYLDAERLLSDPRLALPHD